MLTWSAVCRPRGCSGTDRCAHTNALHGLFIDATARRLSSIAEEAERVGREKDVQSLKLKEHARRVKICERLALTHEQDFEREKEGKQLLDVVEQFVGRKPTSLP